MSECVRGEVVVVSVRSHAPASRHGKAVVQQPRTWVGDYTEAAGTWVSHKRLRKCPVHHVAVAGVGACRCRDERVEEPAVVCAG
jgi:hypothetical protein